MKRFLSFTLAVLMVFSVQFFAFAADVKTVWEFNKDGDMEDWKLASATGDVKNGAMTATAVERDAQAAGGFSAYDPTFTSPDISISAADYKYIVVSMKYESIVDSTNSQIYFKTAADPTLDEKKTLRVTVPKTSEGKTVDIVFNMGSVEGWTGTVTSIRFDPINNGGTFSIDKIALSKDKPAVTTPPTTTTPTTPAEKNYFPEVNKFSTTTFTDIGYSEWYYASVSTAYKIGLMNGTADKTFSPKGTVTVAEAITLTVRVYEIYNGRTGKFDAATPWYQPYVDAAIKAGIIKDGQFTDYTKPISRIDMGTLFSKALPDDYYTAINKFKSIPDVASTNANFNSILKLYNAGIITGVDDNGTYNPDANITRAEVAAIITRVAVKANRVRKESKEEAADKKAAEEAKKKADEEAAKNRNERVKATAIRYDFNDDKMLDKFGLGNCEDKGTIANGFLVGLPKAKVNDKGVTSYDPIVSIPIDGIDLSKYMVIRVGIKWDASVTDVSNVKPNLFFITEASSDWAENKRINATAVYGKKSSDTVMDFTFVCDSNALWTGKLKSLRFDPYDASGKFYIDYVVIEEK